MALRSSGEPGHQQDKRVAPTETTPPTLQTDTGIGVVGTSLQSFVSDSPWGSGSAAAGSGSEG